MAQTEVNVNQEQKEELLRLIVDSPFQFTPVHLQQLISDEFELEFAEVRKCMYRIFDINEKIFLDEADSAIKPNVKSQKKRADRFYQRFREGFNRKDKKVIVAEGDSWFEFPQAIKDIIDHLNDNQRYNVFSMAYGGDWLANIIYDGKYVEKLSVIKPDVFLVSGGGNDMVGADRLGLMVNRNGGCPLRYGSATEYRSRIQSIYGNTIPAPSDTEVATALLTQANIENSFYSFLLILKVQYMKMLLCYSLSRLSW
jgi:hypothetical protein